MPDPTDDAPEETEEEPKPLPSWRIDADAENLEPDRETGIPDRYAGYLTELPDDGAELRFTNPDAEDGANACAGPLSWLNSARVVLDPTEDAVHFPASIFDPRGGFGFTIRRIPGGDNAGILVIHSPYQGAGFLHQDVRQLRPGTLEVVHDANLPEVPDVAGILSDLLSMPGVRGCIARSKLEKAKSLRARIKAWRSDQDKIAAAVPIRVAMPEEE